MDKLAAASKRLMIDFVQMKSFQDDPLILDQGEGIRVRDHRGRWYIDGISGVFVSSLGHGNQRVIQAATDQLNRLAFHAPLFSTNPPAIQLAELLAQIAPSGLTTVKFASGGSEATETALKAAHQYHVQTGNPRKFKVLSHYRGYHGGTGHALAATGRVAWRSIFEPLAAGFVHVHPPFALAERTGLDGDELAEAAAGLVEETILLEGPETVAAFITEPLMLSAGVQMLPTAYVQRLRSMCDRYNIVLIFDEIITGFGRLGEMFAADLLDVAPDLLCVGKAMSGGYAPLSAVLMRDRIADVFWGDADDLAFKTGHTYGGNPVSCAVGVAAVSEILERDLVSNARRMGKRLAVGLRELAHSLPIIDEVRGEGLLLGVTFGPVPDSAQFGRRVWRAAREEGLLVREGPNLIVLGPPLVVTESDVDEIVAIVGRAITRAAASLGTDRVLAGSRPAN